MLTELSYPPPGSSKAGSDPSEKKNFGRLSKGKSKETKKRILYVSYLCIEEYVKVKVYDSRNRPGVAQRVPGV
jgi:hypothetical protein